MHQRRAEEAFKPVKPTCSHTQAGKSTAWEEYRAEQQAALDRMTRQREARLSAGQLVRMKNRAGWTARRERIAGAGIRWL
jgi:hypothetical protein